MRPFQPTDRQCAKCNRPVGRLSQNRARPYTHEITDEGVDVVCENKRACKRHKLIQQKQDGEQE